MGGLGSTAATMALGTAGAAATSVAVSGGGAPLVVVVFPPLHIGGLGGGYCLPAFPGEHYFHGGAQDLGAVGPLECFPCVLFVLKLHKAKAARLVGVVVSGQVDILDRTEAAVELLDLLCLHLVVLCRRYQLAHEQGTGLLGLAAVGPARGLLGRGTVGARHYYSHSLGLGRLILASLLLALGFNDYHFLVGSASLAHVPALGR